MRTLVLALAVVLGSCSASEFVQSSIPAPDLSQPNYRRIVADSINAITITPDSTTPPDPANSTKPADMKKMFPNQATLGELEISGVRLVDHLKGPAWLTCLKLDAHGNPQLYAIFIQGNQVIDMRAGVLVDQCHKETYTPLELSTAAKKPGT